MAFVTANDGVRLDYEEKGRGKPLVLIHGWSCSGAFFRRNVEALAEDFRVVNLDLRGHGGSEKPDHGYRIHRLAKDVRDFLEALDLREATLLGWSMGASVIWAYLELFGDERLSKLVLVDQSPRQYYSPDWKLGQGGCYDAEALAELRTRLEYDPEGVAKGTLAACLTNEPTEEEERFFVGEMLKSPGWVQGTLMADHTNHDWRDLLPRIGLPTLVLVGRKSKIFPWEGSAYVGEHVPGAETVFLEESGHMPFWEEAERFNEVVKGFVGR